MFRGTAFIVPAQNNQLVLTVLYNQWQYQTHQDLFQRVYILAATNDA